MNASIYTDRRAAFAGVAGDVARLTAVARRILRNDDDARDAVQLALTRAMAALDGFDGRAKLSTWLHRIVVNTALDAVRRRRIRREEPLDDVPAVAEIGAAASAERALIEAERAAHLRRAVKALPRIEREALEDELAGLSLVEAAVARGVSARTVKTRRFRARQRARRHLISFLVPSTEVPCSTHAG